MRQRGTQVSAKQERSKKRKPVVAALRYKAVLEWRMLGVPGSRETDEVALPPGQGGDAVAKLRAHWKPSFGLELSRSPAHLRDPAPSRLHPETSSD